MSRRKWFVLFNPENGGGEPLQVSKSPEVLAMSAWSHHRIVEVQMVGEPMVLSPGSGQGCRMIR